MIIVRWSLGTLCCALALQLMACGSDPPANPPEAADPAEVALGERLFLETRFAQYFSVHSGGLVNTPLGAGDPLMDVTQTTGAPLPGPFAGTSMNCRACHLVDEQGGEVSGGVRTYADFARRSPIPLRADGRVVTPRNSPPLVNSTLPRSVNFFLHFDGEFASVEDLVRGTFTGRNFGWLPNEVALAVAQIATVVRADDGTGTLAQDFGGLPYAVVFQGTDPSIPTEFVLPEAFRIDVASASDAQILDAVAKTVGAYVESLIFTQNADGAFSASPYDQFLRLNKLPRQPSMGESDLDYGRRLRSLVAKLKHPSYVTLNDGSFELFPQEFKFGPTELAGLRIFLAEAPPEGLSPMQLAAGKVGNCVACHAAPNFTDFLFHNTGAAQDEYDAIHGQGAFAALEVPGLAERNADPNAFLPPSPEYPNAPGPFFAVPALAQPGMTDLGLWNVFANPSLPLPQSTMQETLCTESTLPPAECTPERLLPLSIALFKTPGLRSLVQSPPFLHTGRQDTLEDVLDFYMRFSALARSGEVRNADARISGIGLTPADTAPLVAFLQALDEDYQ